ncbi:related to dynactin arp1 p62 subunit RO-2 [Cephalotrichum gorgonifer]|uniref:Dynactin subunit 4 n=1 Tax=Cephalotrichum gorgonifer TaxID=2041049 RepID=A0AAE8MXI9_9PEZI|nr:related to dynactin arp1 p62 subunit RO-2 [Cephalotrichum gorgonifer]
MAAIAPYNYVQCPCSDPSTVERPSDPTANPEDGDEYDDDDRTFDPRAPRSNYSLYPLEHLMYCEDCQEIRCQRCVNEEIVTYFCPSCLFEVPSSNIKSEGNRCTRSCFQCPICIGAPLAITSVEKPPDPNLLAPDSPTAAPSAQYVLCCTYCQWTSSEIDVKLEKSSGVHAQLAKLRNGGGHKLSAREHRDRRKENPDEPPIPDAELDPDLHFASLKSFLQAQLADASVSASGGLAGLGDLGFSSPGSLSRLMSLYTGSSLAGGGKRGLPRAATAREARSTDDGLKLASLDESAQLDALLAGGWHDTVSAEQREAQGPTSDAHVVGDLRPVPTLLRTKRSKRCPVCRHIIAKPDAKVTSTRYRIRLVASHYVPTIAIRSLPTSSIGTSISRSSVPVPTPNAAPQLLRPGQAAQFILTFKNPIFEDVKVTLGTPSVTPGRFPSKITVLCPQFTIGANTDMWDDALKDENSDTKRPDDGQAAAGKIWERGRNWVSIVVEAVPASLRLDGLKWAKSEGEDVDDGPLREDEDILEIPVFVRVEWEAEAQEVGGAPGRDKNAKEKRELAYWCVLGLGRIAQE